MTIELRPITEAEWDEYVALDAYAFAYEHNADALDFYRSNHQIEWTLAAFEHGRMVAHLMTRPWSVVINGATLPMGAIADVAVWPEDRRAGHAAAMLGACLRHMRDAGRPLSMLYPTFPALYQRFGWAHAAEWRTYSFRPADLRFTTPVARPDGRAERTGPESLPNLMRVYDALLPDGNCLLPRSESHWRSRHLDQPGRPPRQIVVWRDRAGAVQGYLLHATPSRITSELGVYDQKFLVHELTALTPSAYRGLIELLARHDLAATVTWPAPPDDPLPSLLTTPAALKIEHQPTFMLRLVDLVPALEGRGYLPGPPVRLTLRVTDATAPWNDGVWDLEHEHGKMRVTPSSKQPALAMDTGTLAALYNGFLTPTRAAAAGLMQVIDTSALAAVAVLFAVKRPPYCMDHF